MFSGKEQDLLSSRDLSWDNGRGRYHRSDWAGFTGALAFCFPSLGRPTYKREESRDRLED